MKTGNLFYLSVPLLLVLLSLANTSCTSGGDSASSKDQMKGKLTISGALALYPLTVNGLRNFISYIPGSL